MKKHLLSTLAIATVLTTMMVVSAHAQNAGTITVTIPFEFTAVNKTLPAGDYVVRLEDSRSELKIQKSDGSTAEFVLINPVYGRDPQNHSKLVFHRYGSQYFLAQVWIVGSSSGEELRQSTQERGIRRELAALRQKPQRIEIAVRAN